jgi:hypothetical protein
MPVTTIGASVVAEDCPIITPVSAAAVLALVAVLAAAAVLEPVAVFSAYKPAPFGANDPVEASGVAVKPRRRLLAACAGTAGCSGRLRAGTFWA